MSEPAPQFHLQKIRSDGTHGPLELYSVGELVQRAEIPRRGFYGTGITLASALALAGCQKSPPPAPVAPVGVKRGPIHAHTQEISALQFSPDGSLLVTGAYDNNIKVWEMPNGNLKRTLSVGTSLHKTLILSADGKRLYSKSDTTIKIWALPEFRLERTLSIGHDTRRIVPAPDGRHILCFGSLYLDILSVQKESVVKRVDCRENEAWWIDGGRQIVCVSSTPYEIQVLAEPEWNVAKAFRTPLQTRAQGVAISPDGRNIAVAHGESDLASAHIDFWNVADGAQMSNAVVLPPSTENIKIWYSADGNRIFIVNRDSGKLFIVSTHDGLLLESKKVGFLEVLIFSKDRLWVATADAGERIYVYSFPEWHLKHTFTHRSSAASDTEYNSVKELQFSPDNRLLASGDDKGGVYIWDLSSGAKRGELFDPDSNENDASVYAGKDSKGNPVSTSLPAGSPIPIGYTICICNTVPARARTKRNGTWCVCIPVGSP
jgi:WD40 repeat protein